MPELLLELGCEELPASFVEGAYRDLADRLVESLNELYQGSFTAERFGTPRRLIVRIDELPELQPDTVKELRGPGLKAAYDADGKPTGALLGFCRSQGLDVEKLRRDEQYVWATKTVAGLPTAELLATVIPAAIRKLTFEKSMRWGPLGAKFRFARPIRWILAIYGGSVVQFEMEGVQSGVLSRGHRFYAPESFEATSFSALMVGLRERHVEPDPVKRKEFILSQTAVLAPTAELTDALVDENVFLTEWPTPILGEFREEFLELPEQVLTTAMAKHEKMFPVRASDGSLTNQFVFIRNSGEDGTVRRGAEWVLNARLADADFFYREDKKSTMEDFLQKTSGIVFQAQLGTVRDRAERLSRLSELLALHLGADPAVAGKAGLYAKADLSSGLVAEFNSLQGVVGGAYALREGFEAEVCEAISDQYRPAGQVTNPASVALVAADALDKLAGYLGIGLIPSGSADPYGLRRAATNLINARLEGNLATPFKEALALYAEQGIELKSDVALAALSEIFASRYESLFTESRHDLVQAAVYGGEGDDRLLNSAAVVRRLEWLESLAEDASLVQTMLRPLNIYKSFKEEVEKRWDLKAGLESASGAELVDLIRATGSEDPAVRLKMLAPLIHDFFESTMIMDKDDAVRAARQGLVAELRSLILAVGDFTKIVIDGN